LVAFNRDGTLARGNRNTCQREIGGAIVPVHIGIVRQNIDEDAAILCNGIRVDNRNGGVVRSGDCELNRTGICPPSTVAYRIAHGYDFSVANVQVIEVGARIEPDLIADDRDAALACWHGSGGNRQITMGVVDIAVVRQDIDIERCVFGCACHVSGGNRAVVRTRNCYGYALSGRFPIRISNRDIELFDRLLSGG